MIKKIQQLQSELILFGEERGKQLYFNMEIYGDSCSGYMIII